MTLIKPKIVQVQLDFSCRFCEANPGETCRSPKGKALSPHNARFQDATEAGLLPLKDVEL